ncbi:MAG TPA: hypothetical protein VGE50_06935 [Gammaproteobacteria bacterium]
MNEQRRRRTVVLALDSSPGAQTLQMALQLAMQMQARLEGVFVEDTDLLQLARLPFAREIILLSAQLRPFASDALEQELRSQALRLQRQLAREAEARQLEWGFSVVRDRLLRAVRAAASDADLFIMQSHRRPRTSPLAAIGVVYDGTMAPIETAAQLAQHGTVRVFLSRQFDNNRSEITQRITSYGAHPVFITLHNYNPAELGEVARHQRLSLLILPNTLVVDDASLQPLLESAPCTVVVKEHPSH